MFPFSATLRKKKIDVKIVQEKNPNSYYFTPFSDLVNNKQKELLDHGITITQDIVGSIIKNTSFYYRMNIYLLFYAYQIFFDISDPEYYKYLREIYPSSQQKFDFEIRTYVIKINEVERKMYNLFLAYG